MIYFIKLGEHIKVGYTRDNISFKTRLATYNTSNPFEIEIINLIEGDFKLESNILNHFIGYHCKGEWFYFNKEIVNFAMNPYELEDSKFLKPLKDNHKIIENNLEEILYLYENGMSLKELQEKFKVNRKRIVQYIPEDIKRKKNELLNIRKQKESVNNKLIICLETNQIFISASEASRIMKLNLSKICEVCNGNRNHTGNFTFKYLENE